MANNSYVLDALVTGPETVVISDDGDGFDEIIVLGVYADAVDINLAWVTDGGLPTQAQGNYFTRGENNSFIGHRLVINGVIEKAVGSNGREFMQGSDLDNTLYGEALFTGVGDNDTIWGGAGSDLMHGGMGNDEMNGDEDNDSLYGDGGADNINGGGGIDIVNGGAGADVLSGGADARDLISFAGSALGVTVNLTFGTTTTGQGGDAQGDSINGFTDAEGSSVGDVITDTVKGTVAFGQNDNIFSGGAGNDRLVQGGGNDTGYGGDGNDSLYGEIANDSLNGGDGRDKLYGGEDNDILNGGLSNDTMEGGTGNDTFYCDSSADIVVEAPDQGRDRVISSVNWTLQSTLEDLTLAGTAVNGAGNSFSNRIVGNELANNLKGWFGNDVILGMAGNDTVEGGAGRDQLNGGAGADSLKGGAIDADRFIFATLSEIATAAQGYDRVADFKSAELDKIDLSGLDAISGGGNDAFHFIGLAAFGGHKGELRYTFSSGNCVVSGDIDGNSKADFVILVQFTTALAATDFIL